MGLRSQRIIFKATVNFKKADCHSIMMESETPVKCRKCQKQVSFNELANHEGSWICHDCYEKIHFFTEPKFSARPEHMNQASAVMPSKPGMKLYMCFNCGYKLEREFFDVSRGCPYCGEKGAIRPN